MFVDRHRERAVLDGLVEALHAGQSRALIVDGEPGVGKTALLDYLVERASGCRVARASGVQSEMELAFAGLHQLCVPMLDQLERLPAPQRDALGTAFGLSDGPAPDRFLVGLAVLGLLAEVARERPLLCVVDDAQWLDSVSAQTLAFVARRLEAESVALVLAMHAGNGATEFAGLAQLVVAGLPEEDARQLLNTALHGPIDDRVRDRIVAEARGNPLALLELPRGLTPTELAGAGLPRGRGLPGRIEESYWRQLAPLPADARRLLLVAAAEPLGEPVLLWRAAERLGIGIEAAAPAVAARLLEIGDRVRFRHPLVRSAVYRTASPDERREAHRALAEAIDAETGLDRGAWHAAQAATGPNEDIAAALEQSAGRAQARGGRAAAAAFLERAAELTPDPARLVHRALDAAQARHQAGMPHAAMRLLSLAQAGPLDEHSGARADLLRGQIALVNRSGEAVPLLLNAARRLEPLDIPLARGTYLEALWGAWFTGPAPMREAAQAARTANPPPNPPRALDLLLDGWATWLTDGDRAGLPLLKQALHAFRDPSLPAEEGLHWLHFASVTAAHLWDDEAWEVLATRQLQLVRDTGALAMHPLALDVRIGVHTFFGELSAAESLAEEHAAVSEATRVSRVPYGALVLAAWRGREAEAVELFDAASRAALRRGEEIVMTAVPWASALLYNSLCRYEDALASARQASAPPDVVPLYSTRGLVELIEAAARTGETECAADALQRLTESTRAAGSEWAFGVQARSRALLSDGAAADTAYREAIDRFGRTRVRGELARAHLLYGEWLRRANRRLDAREQLRTAYQMFTAMEMDAFAERAERELQTTGETARKRSVDTGTELTAQERQIARLVAEGLSNPEIAARLFISPRTVEWHLKKIFSKLSISSRKQLRRRNGSLSTDTVGGARRNIE